MANARRKTYFEPWAAIKSAQHGPRPVVDGMPTEAAEFLTGAWERIDRDAEWIIWGSRMATPALCKGLDGTATVADDRRIIAVRRTLGLPEGAPKHEDVAKRIAACVNACAGVADPEKFIKDVRSLLMGYARGECDDPRRDDRVVSLLSRCVPPEEMDNIREAED